MSFSKYLKILKGLYRYLYKLSAGANYQIKFKIYRFY